MREARVGARLVGGGGGARIKKFYEGKFFHVCDLYSIYSIREGYFLRVWVFFTPYGPVCMGGGGREFLWLPLSPDNTFLRETLFVTYRGDHQGRSQDLGGGRAKIFFFQIWKFACREAIPFARGARGYVPPKFFFKLCNLVRFGVYILIRFSP